jgi:hypothetical protein
MARSRSGVELWSNVWKTLLFIFNLLHIYLFLRFERWRFSIWVVRDFCRAYCLLGGERHTILHSKHIGYIIVEQMRMSKSKNLLHERKNGDRCLLVLQNLHHMNPGSGSRALSESKNEIHC